MNKKFINKDETNVVSMIAIAKVIQHQSGVVKLASCHWLPQFINNQGAYEL